MLSILVICFPVFPRELVTCAIVFQLCRPREDARITHARPTITAGAVYFNNRAHINNKAGSNVAPGGKYPWEDLDSAAHV